MSAEVVVCRVCDRVYEAGQHCPGCGYSEADPLVIVPSEPSAHPVVSPGDNGDN